MNKVTLLSLLLIIGFISCKNLEKGVDKIGIAKQYYDMLDSSEYSRITSLLTDSIITKEIDYELTLSQAAYMEQLKWDSVFEPTYEILQIEQENSIVKARVSKKDKRVLFLHEEPIVTDEIIRFHNSKITSVEITDYVIFNDATFSKNRSKLLNWIDKNHPELNGFIHDQTLEGGLNYLKSIELYNQAN